MKTVLVNTKLKEDKLLRRLHDVDLVENIGFDTEIAGPLVRGQDFTNVTYAALLGFSVAFENEECFYVPVRHKGANASFWGIHQILEELIPLCSARRVWAHNAQFDYMVMKQFGYELEGLMCSKIAAWLSTGHAEKLGLKDLAFSFLNRESPPFDPAIMHKTAADVLEYACHDALNTLQLGISFRNRDELRWFYEECDFALLLADLKIQGIRIDRKGLARVREEGSQHLDAILSEWDKLAPFISITSAQQLQQLYEEGIWVEYGRTQTGAFSTGKDAVKHQLENGRGDGKRLAELRLEYQAINKVVTTYTDGLIEESLQWRDKKLHPDLWHFGTVTGRLSSSNPNIQNQPAHGQWAQKIRECFIPDAGMEFTSADYSQVELRYFADYCGGNLLQAFVDGADLHEKTAEALGISRQQGKTVNFGFLLYGGGARKLARLLLCSEDEARHKIAALRQAYPEIEVWRERALEFAEAGYIPWCKTKAGRIRFVPELKPIEWSQRDPAAYNKAAMMEANKYGFGFWDRSTSRGSGFIYKRDASLYSRGKRLLVNYLIQGGSRDLLVLGMNEYRRRINHRSYIYPSYSIVTTVHDEVLTQHPIGEGEEARALLKECLESAGPKLGLKVPIIAEPKTGGTWAEVK